MKLLTTVFRRNPEIWLIKKQTLRSNICKDTNYCLKDFNQEKKKKENQCKLNFTGRFYL